MIEMQYWKCMVKVQEGAWVLRDFTGKVILQSRRTFSGFQSKDDSKLKIIIWALESVCQHGLDLHLKIQSF